MLSRRYYSSLKKIVAPLTNTKHPEIKRGLYKKLTNEDVSYFKSILPSTQQIKVNQDVDQHNVDFFNLFRGSSKLCLFPTSVDQVSSILSYCHKEKIAVVPQGGNTGVSGGAIPLFDEVIVNTSKMNKIRSFDSLSGIAVVDAGVVLESLNDYLENEGYTVPLDLGAKGSCQLGGNVSTNAGGLRLLRFGNLHGNVLGLEVVLPDGTVLDGLSTLRKDNTGYDLKQLFIGAEGTLGLVTGVSLLTPKKAASTNVALLALDSFEQVQQAFVSAKSHLGEILSAFEFWDRESVGVVKKAMIQEPFPIGHDTKFYALLETQGSRQDHDMNKLELYLEQLMENEIIQDGVLAQDEKQFKSLWQWREKIPESLTKLGTAMTYDFSMAVPLLYKMVEDATLHFGQKGLVGDKNDHLYANIVGFGHMGDGNLHIMANVNGVDEKGQEMFDDFVFNWAIKHKGSISAEHGIGIHKVNYMQKYKSKNELKLMHAIKQTIDPHHIMNPYKVLPKLE